jgi:protein TonB
MPQFPGGQDEMYRFIGNNLKYPAIDQEMGTQGRVTVRFVVSKTGEITNIELLKGISPTCDKEAIRVIKSMPKWIPGKQSGNPVQVYFTMPIVFKLKT